MVAVAIKLLRFPSTLWPAYAWFNVEIVFYDFYLFSRESSKVRAGGRHRSKRRVEMLMVGAVLLPRSRKSPGRSREKGFNFDKNFYFIQNAHDLLTTVVLKLL